MGKRFKYSGDVNIEHGGYFYSTAEWRNGYAEAVRVTPCSDAIGAQDNCFWIDELTIVIPDTKEKLRQTLGVIGMTLDAQGNIVDESQNSIVAKPRTAAYRAVVVDACVCYGAYDRDSGISVSIGKPDPDYTGREPVEPDQVLRGNTDLSRYVRRAYLRNA